MSQFSVWMPLAPSGAQKDGPVPLKSTISHWISEAYSLKEKVSPFLVRAHSTRVVGASWATRHQTFTKHYQVDVRATEEGHVWLQYSAVCCVRALFPFF